MITYIELWQAKQSWVNLSMEDRSNYLTALGPAIQQLLTDGVQILSWGINDGSTFHRADFDYFAVWSFPDEKAAVNFEKMVEAAGWYNYFDQVNARGATGTPQDVMAHMMSL